MAAVLSEDELKSIDAYWRAEADTVSDQEWPAA